MAKSTVTRFTCDRCDREYLESEPEAPSSGPQKNPVPVVVIEAQLTSGNCSPMRVLFDDLCPKCDARVADLIAQIALDENKKSGKEDESKTPEPSLDAKPKAADNKEKADAGKATEKPVTTH